MTIYMGAGGSPDGPAGKSPAYLPIYQTSTGAPPSPRLRLSPQQAQELSEGLALVGLVNSQLEAFGVGSDASASTPSRDDLINSKWAPLRYAATHASLSVLGSSLAALGVGGGCEFLTGPETAFVSTVGCWAAGGAAGGAVNGAATCKGNAHCITMNVVLGGATGAVGGAAGAIGSKIFSAIAAGLATSSTTDAAATLFRGTSLGFEGGPGALAAGVTPASTDPVVATNFATLAEQSGPGVVHIASPEDLAGLKITPGNAYVPNESEMYVGTSPTDFASRAGTMIPAPTARAILSDMGISVPAQIFDPSDLSAVLGGSTQMSREQIAEFIVRARGLLP